MSVPIVWPSRVRAPSWSRLWACSVDRHGATRERARHDLRAICVDDDGSIRVGSEHLGPHCSITLEHLLNRVPKMVAAARAGDRDLWVGGVQELPAAGRQAAVMPYAIDG